MPNLRILSTSEQVAQHLSKELWRYTSGGALMGVAALARELGVNHRAVDLALAQLEREGILTYQGAGKCRKVVAQPPHSQASLKIAMLMGNQEDVHNDYILEIQRRLGEAGHAVVQTVFRDPSNSNTFSQIKRSVTSTSADAWIVVAGTRETLEWFAAKSCPVFALFGRREELPLAGIGPDKQAGTLAATRALIALGHQRIVMIVRKRRRLPTPGMVEAGFLKELERHGIPASTYNLPDWDEHPDGLHQRLESIFRVTPPSALIVDESPIFLSVQQFLAQRGVFAPRDISLVCTDGDPCFYWLKPSVAHIAWDHAPVVKRIVTWANHVSTGHADTRQSLTPCAFVPGDSIGPASTRL